MAERDAFGNEIGESSKAGTTPSGLPAPQPVTTVPGPGPGPAPGPVLEPGPVSTPGPGPASTPLPHYGPRGGARLARRLIPLVASLAILGGIGLVVASVGNDVSHRVGDVRRAISTGLSQITVPTTVPSPATPATPPTGFGRGSLLLRANFATALGRLRQEGARLRSLRVAPDRIDASLLTRDGRMKQVQITSGGEVRRFGTSGPGFSTAGTFLLAGVVRAAPFRLARSAAGRAKRAPSAVDYLVAIDVGGEQGWTVVLKGGGQYLADHAGRITRRIN